MSGSSAGSGFDYRIVFAVSGAMGGSASEEFLAPTPVGEDSFVQCTNCDYAANTEAVVIAAPQPRGHRPSTRRRRCWTRRTRRRSTRSSTGSTSSNRGRAYTAADTLKNVVLRMHEPGTPDWRLLVVGVPGDREVDLKRLNGQLEPTEVAPAEPADLAAVPALVKGYIGPQMLGENNVDQGALPGRPARRRGQCVGDRRERGGQARRATSCGAVTSPPDGEIGAVEIRDGDRCARCGGELQLARGIELGHVFQLGRKYADDVRAAGARTRTASRSP